MSVVWTFFIKCADDVSKAQCSICNKKVYRGGTNSRDFTTSNLIKHLKNNHNNEFMKVTNKRKRNTKLNNTVPEVDSEEELENIVVASTSKENVGITTYTEKKQKPRVYQPTISSVFESKLPLTYNSPKAMNITNLIAKMIVRDQLPFHHIEKQGFKNLMKYVEPRYTIPDRTTFSRTIIPDLYNKVSLKIMELLKNVKYASFTSDLWSSINNTDYLSITCHFINEEFVRENLLLEVIPFKPLFHTSDEIYMFTMETLEKWGLDEEKIHVYLRDNAANMEKAFSNKQFYTFGCFTHSLQLVINDVICKQKEHEDLFKKVRQIVGHFKHSIASNKLLKNYQKQEKLPEHKFIQDVTTRWNSKYLMINRFLEQKKCVIGLGPYIRLDVILTSDEWSMLAEISKVLEIFHTVTLTLSKEASSLSEVIPVLRCLTTYLQKEYNLNQSSFSKKLLLSIQKRFPNYEKTKLLTRSTILDPRFKDKVFSEDNEKIIAVNDLKQELEAVYNSWPNIASTSYEQEISTNSIPILKKSLFRDILPDYREPQQCTTAGSEIETYLKEDLLNEEDDIYEYWSRSKFSGLKELATRYHSSPSSSVDSERAFSTAGFICSKSRNALNPEKVRQLIFCSRNIKYLG